MAWYIGVASKTLARPVRGSRITFVTRIAFIIAKSSFRGTFSSRKSKAEKRAIKDSWVSSPGKASEGPVYFQKIRSKNFSAIRVVGEESRVHVSENELC